MGAPPGERGERARSFERLYRRHHAEIYRLLLRDLRHPQDAEDVAQTAFTSAFRAFVESGPPERPRSWLYAIALNASRRRFRRTRRLRELPLEEERDASAFEDDPLVIAELREALVGLPERQRAVVLLREVIGLSYAEIAEELHLSVAAVQMLLFRARRTLRARLEHERPRRSLRNTLLLPLPTRLVDWAGSISSGSDRLGPGARTAGALVAAVLATALATTSGTTAPRGTHDAAQPRTQADWPALRLTPPAAPAAKPAAARVAPGRTVGPLPLVAARQASRIAAEPAAAAPEPEPQPASRGDAGAAEPVATVEAPPAESPRSGPARPTIPLETPQLAAPEVETPVPAVPPLLSVLPSPSVPAPPTQTPSPARTLP